MAKGAAITGYNQASKARDSKKSKDVMRDTAQSNAVNSFDDRKKNAKSDKEGNEESSDDTNATNNSTVDNSETDSNNDGGINL